MVVIFFEPLRVPMLSEYIGIFLWHSFCIARWTTISLILRSTCESWHSSSGGYWFPSFPSACTLFCQVECWGFISIPDLFITVQMDFVVPQIDHIILFENRVRNVLVWGISGTTSFLRYPPLCVWLRVRPLSNHMERQSEHQCCFLKVQHLREPLRQRSVLNIRPSCYF